MKHFPREGGEFAIGPQKLAAYAWPGGYPIFYVTTDCAAICATCANSGEFTTDENADADGFQLSAAEVNWEDPHLICDHCNDRIESAYAEPEPIKEAS